VKIDGSVRDNMPISIRLRRFARGVLDRGVYPHLSICRPRIMSAPMGRRQRRMETGPEPPLSPLSNSNHYEDDEQLLSPPIYASAGSVGTCPHFLPCDCFVFCVPSILFDITL
jgi:predicted acylesterase/phospholipase RssA